MTKYDDFYDGYDYPDDKYTNALSRTINEVFDKKDGTFYTSESFFSKPENELILWRRTLEEAILINKPRLVCSHCDQMVRLLGRRTSRGKVAFFAHLHDSDACDIKTSGMSISREEILARKYGKVQESERHIYLKNLIANTLNTEASKSRGFSCVEIEKRINSQVPYLNWRRPDVCVKFNNKNIVFELQLSTTFLDVVVERDIFYRLNNYFIIWIFNFDDNTEYVSLENLMCKDIYYANKRNVFIFDREAQRKSIEEGVLYVKCQWIDENGKFSDGVLISIDMLNFDNETSKPYYFDADKPYYSKYPHKKQEIALLEYSKKELIEGLMSRYNCQIDNNNSQDRLITEALVQMDKNGENASTYSEGDLYGFKYNQIIINYPKYTKVESLLGNKEYRIVYNQDKIGIVDKYGIEKIKCLYNFVFYLYSDIFIISDGFDYKIYGTKKAICEFRNTDSIEVLYSNEYYVCFVIRDGRELRTKQTYDKYYIVYRDKSWRKIYGFTQNTNNNISVQTEYRSWNCKKLTKMGFVIEDKKYNTIIAVKGKSYGLFDENEVLLIPCSYSELKYINEKYIKFRIGEKCGIFDYNENILFDAQYDDVGYIEDGLFKLQRESHWDVVDASGKKLFTSWYELGNKVGNYIETIQPRSYMSSWNTPQYRGLTNLSGQEVIKHEFEDFSIFKDKYILAHKYWNRKEHRYALYDLNCKQIISGEFYHMFEYHDDGLITTYDLNDSYIFDENWNLKFKIHGHGIFFYNDRYVIVRISEGVFGDKYHYEIFSRDDQQEKLLHDDIYNFTGFTKGFANVDVLREDGVLVPAKLSEQLTFQTINEEPLTENLIKGQQKGRWGVSRSDGKVIVPYDYADISFDNGFICVKRGYKIRYGLVSKIGSIEYKTGHFYPSGDFVVEKETILENGKIIGMVGGFYGVYNKQHDIIIPFRYSRINYLENGIYAAYYSDGGTRCGAFSIDGQLIIPFIFQRIESLDNGFLLCERLSPYDNGYIPSKHGWANQAISTTTGNIIWEAHEFREQPDGTLIMKNQYGESKLSQSAKLCCEEEEQIGENLIKYKQCGLYGLKDCNESVLLYPDYKTISVCKENGNIICIPASYSGFRDTGTPVVYDKKLSKILTLTGYNLKSFSVDSYVVEKDGKVGVLGSDGQLLIKCLYKSINILFSNLYSVEKECQGRYNKAWRMHETVYYKALFDSKGVQKTDFCYSMICEYCDRFIKLYVNGSTEIWNKNGIKISSYDIEKLGNEYFISKSHEQYALFDKEGKQLTKYIYKQIRLSDNEPIGLLDFKWVNLVTMDMVSLDLSGLESLDSNLFKFYRGNKVGVVDSIGNILYCAIYDDICIDRNGCIIGKNGFVTTNLTNNIVIEDKTPKLGGITTGKITNVAKFGLFIEIPTMGTGLLHWTKLREKHDNQYNHCEGEMLDIRIIQIRNDGKIDLELP